MPTVHIDEEIHSSIVRIVALDKRKHNSIESFVNTSLQRRIARLKRYEAKKEW